MFGISSTELLVILVIALVVIGPEKLPEVIRTVGRFVGKIQHFTRNVKGDLEKEFELKELKESLNELKNSAELKQLKEELAAVKEETVSSFKGVEGQFKSEVKSLESALTFENEAEKPLDSKTKTVEQSIERESEDPEALLDEIAFDEEFLAAEAEYLQDDAPLVEEGEELLTAPPKGYNPQKTVERSENIEDEWRRILEERQARIAIEHDAKLKQQFLFLEARRNRTLLSEEERRRRLTLRQLELNR